MASLACVYDTAPTAHPGPGLGRGEMVDRLSRRGRPVVSSMRSGMAKPYRVRGGETSFLLCEECDAT
jgi:hypothetical protein